MEAGEDTVRNTPDGLTGAIMAVEGIPDAVTFLHGPGGCRIRHTVLSSAVAQREGEDADGYLGPYYYGYPRVPASYLDEYDFINGAYYKSVEGLSAIAGRRPSLAVVIDSPGAGLIGDDHLRAIRENGLEGVAMHIDEPTASMPATRCCGRTLARVMEHIDPEPRGTREGTVNLLGISLMDKDWRYARDELSSLLGDMGLEVACCPGAGSTVDELARSVDSELGVVVCPEMCSGLTEWYEGRGIPTVRSPGGAPAGFDALESWVLAVADATGRDPTKAVSRIDACREEVFRRFVGMRYNALRIRGMTFSVAGTASVVRPLTEWLHGYLAMAPVAVAVDEGADEAEAAELRGFLDRTGFGDAWGLEPVGCGAVLCEGVTALTMKLAGECRAGIPIGYSSMGIDDIIPRPVYGMQGAMYILDEILHGVRSTRCAVFTLLASSPVAPWMPSVQIGGMDVTSN